MSGTSRSWFGNHSRSRDEEAAVAVLDQPQSLNTTHGASAVSRLELERAAAEDARLLAEIEKLVQSAVAGKFSERGAVSGFAGRHQQLLASVNQILEAASEKVIWYQALLDAVPFPIHAIDLDMRWTYLNKGFEKLMLDNRCIRNRDQAVGLPCSTAAADICNTEKCGIRQLTKSGIPVSHFDWHGTKCKQDTAKIINARGEHIGWVELVQDQTSTIRVKDYTNDSVSRLASNLVQLSQGNFNVDLTVTEGDQHTTEIKAQFKNINDSVVLLKSAIQALGVDTGMLVEAAVEGKLNTRADASKHQGDYRKIVDGVNRTLDAVLLPIGEGNRILAQISEGKVDELITQQYKGDHEKMKLAVNNVGVVVQNLRGEMTRLIQASREGMLNERGKADQFKGAFADLMKGVNEMLDAILLPIGEGNRILAQISEGKIDELITQQYKGDHEKMKVAVNNVGVVVQNLRGEMTRLIQASREGMLSERGKADQFKGAFADLMKGVNEMLDAIIKPLNVSADYVERISAGNIPPRITENYNGDFNKIKNNLNLCIDSINALISDAAKLAQAGADGELSTRADASRHQGDYRKIIDGVNATLESVAVPFTRAAGHLEMLSRGETPPTVTNKYHGDIQKLADGFNSLFDTIHRLVDDAGMLAQAGIDGKLSTRADASRHQGDFRKILDGVNRTLDAVVSPIQEVGAVVAQMASGDLTRQISKDFAGDFNQLKTAVNTLSTQFGAAIRQIGKETTSLVASSGQLNSVSQQMGASADETATQANVVSAAAEQVSRNVQTVATGADEMGASIKEIAKSTAEATRVANMAVKTAGTTNQTIAKLGQSSAEIGQVIKVITSIAQQTNLLALNATIEAARAGEAGKGFAVVANEVKELAKETAKATEDISQKIEAIQGDTKGAVSAIGEISGIIAQISDIQNTIASAIEEQSATTNEIIRNLAEAAKGSTDISRNIGGVAEAARTTSGGAADTQQAARSLEKMSGDLQTLISQFKA